MNDQRLNLANFLGRKAKIGNNLSLAAASYLLLNLGASASAQVIPDNTLPNNSQINQNGNLTEILEGTTAGKNLFHSFKQFSIIQGETAWFNNATTIENILTRVTGDSLSSIDGLIRANGTANLFFLNPNGIIFGPNAQLDIGGSFVGTTADSLKFSDGSEFSAIDPQAPPLLTVNIAPGLQYGKGNGEIVVQGQGNLLEFTPSLTVDRSARPRGLEVDASKTLALVGNNIFIEGGNLTAKAGNIELGSVGDNSLVQLNSTDAGWTLEYSAVSNLQDIILSQASSLEVSGNNGGDVKLQGKQVIITDGSAILSDTIGDRDGGKLQINASELLVVAGTSENLPFISRLSTDVAPTVTGNGGDIELNTSSLIITGGAQVLSSSYSGSDTGNIKVTANDVELSGGSPVIGPSGLFTLVFGSGDGGDLDITANNVSVLGGAQAAAITFGAGKGGDLNVNADFIEVMGTSPRGASSTLATDTTEIGEGGNLSIDSKYLLVSNGGVIQSTVFGGGNGGNLVVKATEIELLGEATETKEVAPSGLFANVEQEATGNGGNLSIETQSLLISDGAQVAINNSGIGNTGTLDVRSNEIILKGHGPSTESFASGLFSNTEPTALGNAGQIIVDTQKLQITDGAEISSTTLGSGAGGSVQINADEIELIGGIPGSASGLFTTVQSQALGSGGNLKIDTDSLKITEGAQIAVSTGGLGDAGTLDINAKTTIELIGRTELGASGIFGNAVSDDGNGGNMTVTTNDLTIRDGATINVSNFVSNFSGVDSDTQPGTGKAGDINVNSQNIILDGVDSSINAATFDGGGGNINLESKTITTKNNAQITAATSGEGEGGSIAISVDEFDLNNQAQISVNSTGEGQAGNIAISSENIKLDESEITATSIISGGGDIDLKAELLSLDNNSLISTSVLDSTGGGGNLTINSDYIIANHNSNLKADAVEGPGGNINITTKAIFFSPDSKATASSEFGVDGVVEIDNPDGNQKIAVVALESEIVDRSAMISSLCSTDLDDRMIVSGKGGLEENPSQALRGQSIWEDLRDFSLASDNDDGIYQTKSSSDNRNPATIVEANNWQVNAEGKVELVTNVPIAFNQCKE